MDLERSLLSMVPCQERIRLHTDFDKCLKCQKAMKERLSKAKSDGIQKFINAAKEEEMKFMNAFPLILSEFLFKSNL